MFELNHALAQDIVDRSMAILPHNVNVMDSQGLILGSGEPGRVDKRHEGAQLVIANGRTVEIDTATSQGLRNVSAGVNVPLLLNGILVGVLGITGDPEQVRTYASLVRMTAEMLLAQQELQTQHLWKEQRCEELQGVLLGEAEPASTVLDEAARLGLKPRIGRTAAALELGDKTPATAVSEWLSRRFPGSWCATLSEASIVWCRPNGPVDFDALLVRAEQHGLNIVRLAEGEPTADFAELRAEARQVSDLITYSRNVLPGSRRISLVTHRLQARLWRMKDEPAIKRWLAPIQRLQENDPAGSFLITLRAWCAHNGQARACAESLGIHRNTLRYRLERIRSITGLSTDQVSDLVTLYLGSYLIDPES